MLGALLHKKAAACLLTLSLCASVLLYAQDDDPDIETDWDLYSGELYVRGDQTFIISLGTIFPLMFINNGELLENKIDPPVGGSGLLAYNYYLSSKFFIGGEVGGMFLPTIGRNTIFMIPLGFRAGIHFIASRFEFPVNLAIGMTWHNYLNLGYYGLYAKLGAAAFFRATSEWSFGITTHFGWYPEWTSEPAKNVDGYLLDTMLSARYHF